MIDVIDLSDDDDCILESVTITEAKEANKNHSKLYYEVCKINQHLADFIDKCLYLENSKMMLLTLKCGLLREYNQIEESVRESAKIQKALRRANNLLNTNPEVLHSHIKDLCEILKAYKVKKKVPFITLTTDLKDKTCEEHRLKRCNTEEIKAHSDKRPKLDINHLNEIPSPFIQNADSNHFNDTTDSLDENIVENCSHESNTEKNFLVPKKDGETKPEVLTSEEKIKKLESKLAFYKRKIAYLDELEVNDDSVNSPYIKSERLKLAVVMIYKELCQLTGSESVKRKEIRLQVVDGHPPGPTRILETFLNNNIGSDGHPPFPDFCDVVNCVTEANVKDDLGWTKNQIMKEACMLFTQCGRALQKRRQNREYRDLLCRVNLDDCNDPADHDPELMARLEENKRIAIKKESEILERYTMMESLPSKPKTQKHGTKITNTENETINNPSVENNSLQAVTIPCNMSIINEKQNDDTEINVNEKNTTKETIDINSNLNLSNHVIDDNCEESIDVTPQNMKPNNFNDKAIQGENNNINNKNEEIIDSLDKISNKTVIVENKNIMEGKNDTVDNKMEEDTNLVPEEIPDENNYNNIKSNSGVEIKDVEIADAGHQNSHGNDIRLDSSNNVKDYSIIQSKNVPQNLNIENINDTEKKGDEFLAKVIKREPEEDLSNMFEGLGDDFSVIIENVDESIITIEISSDSSDDEQDKE